MRVNGVVMDVLLDTCAEMNVMSLSCARKLQLTLVATEESVQPLGSTVSVRGLTDVMVNSSLLRFKVLDQQLSRDSNVIIGWPSLREKGFSCNVHNGKVVVTFGGECMSIEENSTKKLREICAVSYGRSVDVRVSHSVTLKPKEQHIVSVRYDKDVIGTHDRMMVRPSQVLSGTPLRLAAGVVNGHLQQVLVSNWSDHDVTIKKGALIASLTVSPLEEVLVIDDAMGVDQKIADEMDGFDVSRVEVMPSVSKEELNGVVDEIGVHADTHPSLPLGLFKNLMYKWRGLFAGDSPGVTTKTKLFVHLKDTNATPVKERPRRLAVRAWETVKDLLAKMLKSGVIEPVKSAWAAPIVLAKKANGGWRFCVDYTRLNGMVVKDSYPLPNIEEMVDLLRDAKVMSVMDLSSGFWQVPVHESAKEKLAFTTHFGTYTFRGMPFGFVNAPGIFQRAIAETLDPLLFKCVMVYVDDIIIYSRSIDEHIGDLENVFKLLDQFGWKVNLAKCKFARVKVDYLGYAVGGGTIAPAERNLDKLRAMKRPETAEEMESFLGVIGYYKKFVQGYDYLIQPLRAYVIGVRKDGKKRFVLEDDKEAMEAYNVLLGKLTSAPVLRIYNPTIPTVVKTDCSAFAWGAVLCQVYDEVELPVAFASGTLNSSQRNWPAWKREAYASLRAMEKWRYYLLGTSFKLVTDHQANVYLFDLTRPSSAMLDNWKIILSQYDYTVEHRPGKSLVLEDALSRSPELLLLELSELIISQKSDECLSLVRKWVEGDRSVVLPNDYSSIINHFVINDDVLCFVTSYNKRKVSRRSVRVVLPAGYVKKVFEVCHGMRHFGLQRTYDDISSEYWCLNLYKKVKELFITCVPCQKNRITRLNNVDPVHVVASEPFEILEMDYVVVSVESNEGYRYVLCVSDVCSGKVWYLPTKTRRADEAFHVLFLHVFSPFFYPRFIYTDLESAMRGELNSLICEATGIKHEYTRANSIGHTGQVENRNRVVEIYIAKFIDEYDHSDWHKYTHRAAYAYNKSISATHGMSPDYLVFAKNPFSLFEMEKLDLPVLTKDDYVLDFVKRMNKVAKILRKMTTRESVTTRESASKRSLKVGDYVLLSNRERTMTNNNPYTHRKFLSRNIGPYKVKAVDDRNHVVLCITPTRDLTVGRANVELFHGEPPITVGCFYPYLDEIIPVKIPENIDYEEKVLKEDAKKDLDVRSIVGRRIRVYWSSEREWYKATVIGYMSDGLTNLVFYDDARTLGRELSEEYYKAKLFKNSDNARVEKWSLLGRAK